MGTETQECSTISVPKCSTAYKKQCSQKYKEEVEYYTEIECNTDYKEDCDYQWEGTGNNKVWAPIPGTCINNVYDKCGDVQKQKLKQVPYNDCQNVPKQVCNKVPKQECRTVTEQQCQQVPYQDCQNVPQQQCKPVHKKVPQRISRRVPKKVCDGGSGSGYNRGSSGSGFNAGSSGSNGDETQYLCAGGEPGKGSCKGGAGGGLFSQRSDGRWEVVGIGSFSVGGGCGNIDGIPDIYTRVSQYQQWIEHTMNRML